MPGWMLFVSNFAFSNYLLVQLYNMPGNVLWVVEATEILLSIAHYIL